MKKIILIISVICLNSCGNIGLLISVRNNTNFELGDVKVMTDDSLAVLKFKNIDKGNMRKEFLNMNDVKQKDGHYIIEFSLQNKLIIKEFGYYTNGYPLDDMIILDVYNDSIKANYNLVY